MKKRILLPTDFSKNAWNALKYAGELYKTEAVDFYIMNAFRVQSYDIESIFVAKPGDKEYDAALEHSEEELYQTLKMTEIKKVYPDHTYFTMSIFDTPLLGIKRAVELKDIDLVVMGTKGATDSKTVIYGVTRLMRWKKLETAQSWQFLVI